MRHAWRAAPGGKLAGRSRGFGRFVHRFTGEQETQQRNAQMNFIQDQRDTHHKTSPTIKPKVLDLMAGVIHAPYSSVSGWCTR